jgi:exopolysaccharide production protein ExoY
VTPVYPARVCSLSRPLSLWLRLIYGVEPFIAGAGLLLLTPVTMTIAIIITVLSRRSPLVSHTRVGRGGSPLPMLKFRTMWKDSEPPCRLAVIEDVSGGAPGCKSAGDPRVTSRFAAFCRRFSLDELPQLYHVARGEMSLVGPRPITPEELKKYYGDRADEVVSLRPGLTGLWQISGRSNLSYDERKRLDLLLVRGFSPALYFSILLRSIPKVLTGRDAC